MSANRVVAVLAILGSIVLGALPELAGLSWQGTAGVLGSLVVLLGIASRWLIGWQAWEKQQHQQLLAANAPPPVGDVHNHYS